MVIYTSISFDLLKYHTRKQAGCSYIERLSRIIIHLEVHPLKRMLSFGKSEEK